MRVNDLAYNRTEAANGCDHFLKIEMQELHETITVKRWLTTFLEEYAGSEDCSVADDRIVDDRARAFVSRVDGEDAGFLRPPPNTTQRDTLGNHLLALHNLQALCLAVFSANRRFDVELITGKHTVGLKEGRAAAAIDKVLASRNKMRALEQYESWFNGLRKSFDRTTADEDRDFADDYEDV